MNIEEILDDFDRHQRALGMAESTIEIERQAILKFFAFLSSENIENLTDVDTKTMIRFQIHLSVLKNKKGVTYNTRTQNLYMSSIRKLYKYLRRRGDVFYNPLDGLEMAKMTRPLPRNILSVSEMSKLLETLNLKKAMGNRDRAMLEILYSTGMRQAELRHLDLTDLNPDDKTILIREGKWRKDRIVPCGKTAWHWLKKYLDETRPYFQSNSNEQAVFLNKYGGRLSKQGLLVLIKKHAVKAGIKKNISAHCFRHSCATHMADAGCDIRYIQELLGHSSPSTTAVYISVAIRKLKEVHQKHHPREKMDEKVA